MTLGAFTYTDIHALDAAPHVAIDLEHELNWRQLPIPSAELWGAREQYQTPVYQCRRSPYLQQVSAQYIRRQYLLSHNAHVRNLINQRFCTVDPQRQPNAVVGIRGFNQEPTLIERYLDAPIEQVVSQHRNVGVARTELVEVGNLAAASLIHSGRLIVFLLHLLGSNKLPYAVCTGTTAVRLALKRTGVPFDYIGDADPARLGVERLDWGSYYDKAPQILLIDIEQGLAAIAKRYHCKLLTTESVL